MLGLRQQQRQLEGAQGDWAQPLHPRHRRCRRRLGPTQLQLLRSSKLNT
jgi:hypothetical protein